MFRMPTRDKSLLDNIVELDDGEDLIEIIPNETEKVSEAPQLSNSDEGALETFDITDSQRQFMINYLIESYKKDNIFLTPDSYDFSKVIRSAQNALPSQASGSNSHCSNGVTLASVLLSPQGGVDRESRLETPSEPSQKRKKIIRCIYCSRLVDNLNSISIPKVDSITNKWLQSLSSGDSHVEALLRNRLQNKMTTYVLCDLHYNPKHVASYLMGYRLPWPKLP